MRDTEIDVEDFSHAVKDGNISQTFSDQRLMLYLQGMTDWARLWTQLWDRFFALKAQSLGDAKEIESVDLQIKAAKESLPSELTWDTQLFQSYVESGEDQRDTRYRLLTSTVRIWSKLQDVVLKRVARDSIY